jgi:amidohydrolase
MQAALTPLKGVDEQVVLDRRRLHANPELGFEEHETARFVAERLRALGLDPQSGVAGTGVVALIQGARPGKTVMLRADMDALPIDELNDVPYRSRKPGVMHACGHDGHTAILLNAARILVERRSQFAGTIKLVFQPCEERFPGGAVRMIQEGVLESPHVDAVFGLHLAQDLPVGVVCARSGPAMAAADTFTINITWKGGHGATPELCVDAALIAAQVTVALHALVAREVKPIMGAEDFASFLERVPGCFFFVGARNDERGLIWGHHHPRFDVDEAALPLGIELIVAVAERYLAF